MADVVQYKLERMVNELDDLEERGLFSRREIAEIVKQRRKFEYRLKRPSPLKLDFLAYIDYEKHLDSLRSLRKKAVVRQLKQQGNKKLKKSVSDFAGISRILEIYRQATNRFKGDIVLWFQYLQFCKERRNGQMKKILARVIRFHPKVPGLWIYAAAWEFDQNLNVAAARALMQSGLRTCSNSEDLWVEYLRMELTYLNKLKARKVALGEDEGTLVQDKSSVDEKKWRDENKELFMTLDSDKETEEVEPDAQQGELKIDLFQEQGLSILSTVYSSAVEALPSNFGLRVRFLEVLEGIDLARSGEIRNQILADMRKDFSNEPEYWNWLALEESRSKSADPASQLDKAIQVYEEALRVVPSTTMFNLYICFLKEAMGDQNEDNDFVSRTLKVYEMAETTGCITEHLACEHVTFYLQLRRLKEARKLAEKFCKGKFADSVDVWSLRISIEMRCVTEKSLAPSKDDLHSMFDLLRNILGKFSVSKAESLWRVALKFFSNDKDYSNKMVDLSLLSLAKDGGSDIGFSLSSAIVNYVLQKNGIQQARILYKRYLGLPHPGLALYNHCIELETNLASAGDKASLKEARKLYESALTTYDQDVTLWKNYYSLEIKFGTSETSNAVHWRARKAVKDNAVLLSLPQI
ncbi:U3 small nucleolar RNA-associated protein 6 homolog [Impatiens glandulifera]|uniref:U3 small nucleolar RNA-associated protein 6 homolog n=1 Tax=Impatiens glandulifera TaxID=253017 RepID=UPI001FB10256|nr:U3 small nucleolar RNA-associated protein 6 homolog [Impatiens glandulifera]